MQLSPLCSGLLLIQLASSIVQETNYENEVSNPDEDAYPLLYDDFDLTFQPNVDPIPSPMVADAYDQCSTSDISPRGKIRAREAVCRPEEAATSTDLAIPTLDGSFDTENLCPFDMNMKLRVLVCGKPATVEGLTPDTITTVIEASSCKFMRLSKEVFISSLLAFMWH